MNKRPKMSLQDLKDLWPAYDPSGHVATKATQRGYIHKHNPAAKPSKGELTPAQWHRQQRAIRTKEKV